MNIGTWMLERERRKPFNGRLIRGCEAQGDGDDVYMERYFLFRSKAFNVYLHNFLRSDTDRALHDHPWDFVTIILKAGYWEHEPHPVRPFPDTKRRWRRPGSVLFRRATHRHFVELDRSDNGTPLTTILDEIPAITLCIVGPKWREWGFFELDGWLDWRSAFKRWGCKP